MFSLHMHAPENNTRDDSPKNRLAPPQLVATLMPGMTHKIEVHFTPPLDPGAVGTAAKFQDQILVHTQTHNFCVPIRACPTEAKLQLPARIDFSHVARGAEIQREFTISPDSSQPFEFEFKIIQYSALPGELQLTPMHGKVSANESVRVQVTYAPKRYATARISMILQSPQLGLDSRHIEIIGSSAPRSIANARSSSPISEGTIADGTRVVAVMPACDEKSQPDQINVCIVPEAESESLAYASTANQATRRNSSTLRDALDDNIDDVKATLEDLDVDRSGFVTLPQFGEMAKLVLGVGSGQEVTSWNSHRAVVELFDELGGQTGRLQYADIQTKQSCMAAFSQDSIAPVQLPLASLDDDVAHKMVINKTPAIPMINDDECEVFPRRGAGRAHVMGYVPVSGTPVGNFSFQSFHELVLRTGAPYEANFPLPEGDPSSYPTAPLPPHLLKRRINAHPVSKKAHLKHESDTPTCDDSQISKSQSSALAVDAQLHPRPVTHAPQYNETQAEFHLRLRSMPVNDQWRLEPIGDCALRTLLFASTLSSRWHPARTAWPEVVEPLPEPMMAPLPADLDAELSEDESDTEVELPQPTVSRLEEIFGIPSAYRSEKEKEGVIGGDLSSSPHGEAVEGMVAEICKLRNVDRSTFLEVDIGSERARAQLELELEGVRRARERRLLLGDRLSEWNECIDKPRHLLRANFFSPARRIVES